ncbi:hypothetical protein R3P38DRAFT_1114365 [Favolaschia claudopus]|uniref:Uncharacterized protein n=1 Tax=Favolaschia claudopus TaxID=2862362 RepID=A0AAW0B957_9AGAR
MYRQNSLKGQAPLALPPQCSYTLARRIERLLPWFFFVAEPCIDTHPVATALAFPPEFPVLPPLLIPESSAFPSRRRSLPVYSTDSRYRSSTQTIITHRSRPSRDHQTYLAFLRQEGSSLHTSGLGREPYHHLLPNASLSICSRSHDASTRAKRCLCRYSQVKISVDVDPPLIASKAVVSSAKSDERTTLRRERDVDNGRVPGMRWADFELASFCAT